MTSLHISMKGLDNTFPIKKVILKVPEVVLQSVGNTGCNCIHSRPHWGRSPSWGNSRGTGPAVGTDRTAGSWVCRPKSSTAMTCSREGVWSCEVGHNQGQSQGKELSCT